MDDIAAYRTVLGDSKDADRIGQMLAKEEIDVLTFTSSSTVRNFVAALDPVLPLPETVTVACIGPVTAQTAADLGLTVNVTASQHTIDGLIQALIEHSQEQ